MNIIIVFHYGASPRAPLLKTRQAKDAVHFVILSLTTLCSLPQIIGFMGVRVNPPWDVLISIYHRDP